MRSPNGSWASNAPSRSSEHLAVTDHQINVVQNFPGIVAVACISKRNVVEADSLGELSQGFCARLFSHVVFEIHELEDLRGSTQRLLKIVVEERKLAHGVVHAEYRGDEGYKSARCKHAVGDLIAPYKQKQSDSDGSEYIHQRR